MWQKFRPVPGFEPSPLEYKSPLLTTRPRLRPFKCLFWTQLIPFKKRRKATREDVTEIYAPPLRGKAKATWIDRNTFLTHLIYEQGWPILQNILNLDASVSRFGEMSPQWQNLKHLWQNFDCLFFIWQNVEPTLANVLHYWAHFHRYKWPNNEKI